VSLMGENYQDLLAVDQSGIILDWTLSQGGIEVDSLGSTSIIITYSTDTLTDKIGSQWSISLEADTSLIYTLPKGAVLVRLNPSPIGITIVDNQMVITMPAGTSNITYLIGTTGTREHALVLLNTAKADVNEVLDMGIVIDEAETEDDLDLIEDQLDALESQLDDESEDESDDHGNDNGHSGDDDEEDEEEPEPEEEEEPESTG